MENTINVFMAHGKSNIIMYNKIQLLFKMFFLSKTNRSEETHFFPSHVIVNQLLSPACNLKALWNDDTYLAENNCFQPN